MDALKQTTILLLIFGLSISFPAFSNEHCFVDLTIDQLDAHKTGIISSTDECEETSLRVVNRDGVKKSIAKNRHLSVFNQTPPDFPYLVIESSSGGSGCCVDYHFVDRSSLKSQIVMKNAGIFIRIYEDSTKYLVISPTGEHVLLPK